jgi:RNA polymerase sigma-70 factor (ECF subfamily)
VDSAAPRRVDQEAFDELYRGHVRDVYRYSLSLVRDPVDAEDVTQTTFLNALEAFGANPPRKPRQWLITIARNLVYDRHRQLHRRPQQVELSEVPAPPPEDVRVRADEIVSALQGVPSRQRAALLLDGLEGRSRAEIAAELGIEEQSVANLLARGRQNLRLQLDEGMSCKRARLVAPKVWGASREERRAALKHLRYCERCAGVAKPLFGLGSVLLWLRDAIAYGARIAPEAGGLGKVATVAGGSSLAAKAAVVVTVGTVAGGVALHEATSRPDTRPAPQEVAPVAGMPHVAKQVAPEQRIETPRAPVAEKARPARRGVPAPASRPRRAAADPPATVARPLAQATAERTTPHGSRAAAEPAVATASAPAAVSPETSGSSYGHTAEAQVGSGAPPARPAEEHGTESDGAAPAAPTEKPTDAASTDSGEAPPPARPDAPAANPAGARAAAPGRQASPVKTIPVGVQESAPVEQEALGGTTSGGGRTTAPEKPDDANGQTTVPVGQESASSGATIAEPESAGNGPATAPAQQDNSDNGSAPAPGEPDKPGSGPATGPGDPVKPGNAPAAAPGLQQNPADGPATAPSLQASPGNGQTTAPDRQENPTAGQTPAPVQQSKPG